MLSDRIVVRVHSRRLNNPFDKLVGTHWFLFRESRPATVCRRKQPLPSFQISAGTIRVAVRLSGACRTVQTNCARRRAKRVSSLVRRSAGRGQRLFIRSRASTKAKRRNWNIVVLWARVEDSVELVVELNVRFERIAATSA